MRLAAQPRESVALVVHDTLIFSDFCHPILVKIEGMLPGTKAGVLCTVNVQQELSASQKTLKGILA
jgi:hypothetical protein